MRNPQRARPPRWRSHLAARDLIGESTAAITRRPARSFLTALGTVVGVGAFIATTGLASTARAQVGDSFDALKATEVRVTDVDGVAGGSNPFPADVDERAGQLAGVNHAGVFWTVDLPALDVRSLITPSRTPSQIPVVGATPGALRAARPTLAAGVTIDEFHNRRAERVALLGRGAAALLGINRVDYQPAVFIGNDSYTVIGIIDSVARNDQLLAAVVIPAQTAATQLPGGSPEYVVLADVDAGAADVVGDQIAIALRPNDPDRLSVLVPPDPKSLRQSIESDVTGLLYGLAGLALLVGMIGIANTTLVAVLERRSEIGVRRALGARRRHIALQFLAESSFLGAVGGAIGLCLGVVAVVAVSSTRDWTTTIDPTHLILAPFIGAGTGLLAGLQPAARASRITPATALRAD